MNNLQGSKVLITGGARGIGAACTKAFLEFDASIHLLDRDFSDIKASHLDQQNVTTCKADVSDETAVKGYFSQHGPVDILVNCAGVVPSGSIINCTSEEFKAALDVNVTGTFLVTRAAVKAALDAKRSLSIVNIASVISSISAAQDRLAYATSKAAIIGMTKSVAFDFIKENIRCNAICPGTIDTPSLRQRIYTHADALGGRESALEAFNKRQPIGRMGTSEEIAQLILCVASNQIGFMTGSVITADGGFSL